MSFLLREPDQIPQSVSCECGWANAVDGWSQVWLSLEYHMEEKHGPLKKYGMGGQVHFKQDIQKINND